MTNIESLQPYDEYKNSGTEWLGDIPAGWEIHKVHNIISINDEVLPESTQKDYVFDYIEISGVSSENENITAERVAFGSAASRARRVVREGDVIVSTVRTYLKAVAHIGNIDYPLIASTGFAVLRSSKKVNSKYTNYLFISNGLIGEIIALSNGVSYPSITSSKLEQLKIPLPPLETQQKIVDYLDSETSRIDTLVLEMEALIALLQENRKILIAETVTSGISGEYTEFKDSGIEWLPKIPLNWTKTKLKKLSTWNSGATPNTSNQGFYENGSENWAIIADLNDGEVISTKKKITKEAAALTGSFTPINSIMIGMYASVGKLGIAKIPMFTNQAILWTKNVKGIKEKYLFYYLMGIRQEMIKLGNSSTQNNINKTIVEQFPIPLPPLETQQEIVNYLDIETAKIDNLIEQTTDAIKLLKEERKVLISDAVTGKVRVP